MGISSMKKIFNIIITAIVAIVIFIFILTDAGYIGDLENWFYERKYYNTVSKIALEQLEKLEYGQDDAVNKLIALMAESENWLFASQDGFFLIKTGDPEIPFVSSMVNIFTSPDDKNRHHILRRTYIFDNHHYGWVPLVFDLKEFSNGKLTLISRYYMWQGDYEIPFFK